MKTLLIAAFIALTATSAMADGSPCEDTTKMIARLEQQKQSASGTKLQNIKSLLAAARETYSANGCANKK